MAAATTHGGKLSRLAARTTGIGIALIGHLTVLAALAYHQAGQPPLGESPAAIAVDIVSTPTPRAAMVSREPAVVDDISDQDTNAVDHSQAAFVEQTGPPSQSVATAGPATTEMTAAGHSSPRPEVPSRQKVSTKRQAARVAIASKPHPTELADVDGQGSTVANGSSVANSNAPSTWKNRLLSHLDRYKRYPDVARAQRAEGTALLSFGMDRDGRVLTFYLVSSSGCPELDDEVLAMIQRASPLPPAPPELQDRVVQLVVPVRFSL